MVKRSLLYLRRKYKRSVLLLLLLFVISFSLAVGVTVWNSIGAVTKEVQDALGTSFTFRIPSYITNDASYYKEVNDSSGNAQKCYVGPKLDNETIQQIMQNIDGITGYNAEMDNYVCVEDADLIPGMHSDNWKYDFGDPDTNARMSQRQYVTMIYGNSKTELYNEFRSGSFELIAGRHITPNDTYKTLISDELAEANGLKIGDILTLTARAGIAGLVPPTEIWGEPLPVEIVGIFHVNGYQPTGQWVAETDMSYNWLITDIETVNYFNEVYNKELYVGQAYELRYRNVTFFVEDASQLDATIKAVQDLNVIDTSYYEISADDTMYKATVDPLNSIRNMVVGIVAIIVLGCFVVLCIVFTMWVRSRRQEVAIYLSLGFSKFKIIGQFVLEAGIIAAAAAIISFAACQQVPDMIGNSMLSSTIEAAQPEEKEYSREEIHQAASTGTMSGMFVYESSNYAGPDHIDFSFRLTDFLILLALELLIILAAICKGGSFIFELQPKQILTTLS